MLYAYNKTTSNLTLAAVGVIIPASATLGVRGPKKDVTNELSGLSNANYTLIQAQVDAGSVEFWWSGAAEYATPTLKVLATADGNPLVDIDVYISATGDDNNSGTSTSKILTASKLASLRPASWRRHFVGRFDVGTYNQAAISYILSGGPSGSGLSATAGVAPIAPSAEVWAGTFVDQVGTLTVGAGSTTTDIIAAGASAFFRSGAAASVTAVSGSGLAKTATITGLTGMTSADVGKQLYFSLATNPGNNCSAGGSFTIASFISATSVTIRNAQAVVEATGAIYWQDSYRGSFLRLINAAAANNRVRRKVVRGHGMDSTGLVNVVSVANLADNDYFFVPDGVGAGMNFEYKVTGGFAAAAPLPRTTIDVSALADPSAIGVAVASAAAMNAVLPTVLQVRTVRNASGDTATTAQMQVRNMIPGAFGNVSITENVAHASFTVSGFTGGTGATTTTFNLDSAYATAPSVGVDTFVVEKPGTIINMTGSFGLLGRGMTQIGFQGIKFICSSAAISWISTTNYVSFDGCEFDLGGGGLINNSVDTIFGSNYANNDPNGPMLPPGQSGGVTAPSMFIHDGTLATSNRALVTNSAGGALIFNQCSLTVTQGDAVLANCDSFRTTLVGDRNGELTISGASGAYPTRMNGTLLSTDAAIIDVTGSSVASTLTNLDISNSGNYGVEAKNGSQLILQTLVGNGNAKAGIHVDLRSGGQIDTGATVTAVTGNTGDFEFGHETVANIRTYAAVRTADGTGTKGFDDGHGNRIDA